MAQNGQVAHKTVFYADVLGFGHLSETLPAGAEDSLAAMANLLSRGDVLGEVLNRRCWVARYGLSDSLFLVAEAAEDAVAAAAEIFFNLAYASHAGPTPVLIRGGIAQGETSQVGPLFPESAKANLVGPAVVRAVRLEGNPLKGPRLFVTEMVAAEIERCASGLGWLLDRRPTACEILWPLPPRPDQANGLLIGEWCDKALGLIERKAADPEAGKHYLGYLDVAVRALSRLLATQPEQARVALATSRLRERAGRLEELLMSPEVALANMIRNLVRQ